MSSISNVPSVTSRYTPPLNTPPQNRVAGAPLAKQLGISPEAFQKGLNSNTPPASRAEKTVINELRKGNLNLNVTPDQLDASTSSKAGSEIKDIAAKLGVEIKGKTVRQLVNAIGEKTAGTNGITIKTKVVDILLTAVVKENGTTLGAGAKVSKDNASFALEATVNDRKPGIKLEAIADIKAQETNSVQGSKSTLGVKVKADTLGGVSAEGKLSVLTKNVEITGEGILYNKNPAEAKGSIKYKFNDTLSVLGEASTKTGVGGAIQSGKTIFSINKEQVKVETRVDF